MAKKKTSCFKILDNTYQKVLKKCELQYKGKPKQVNSCISGTLYTTMLLSNEKNKLSGCKKEGYD